MCVKQEGGIIEHWPDWQKSACGNSEHGRWGGLSPCALLMGRRLWQPSCRVTVHCLVTLGAVRSPGGSASDCPKENLNTRPKAV